MLRTSVFITPPGTVEDGYIKKISTFCSELLHILRNEKYVANRVVFTLASTKIYTKEIIVPYVNSTKLKKIIDTNVGEYLPFSLEEYVLNYSVIKKFKENKETKLRVQLIAIPNNLVKNYYNLADSADLIVEAIDYSGNSVYQQLKQSSEKGVSLFLQVKDHNTAITILDDKALVLQRTISTGVNGFLQAIMEQNFATIENEAQAYQLIENYDMLSRYSTGASKFQLEYASLAGETDSIISKLNLDETVDAITEAADAMIRSLSRVIDYYMNQSGNPIQHFYVLGYGAKIKGLREYIQKELGVLPMVMEQLVGCKPSAKAIRYMEGPSEFIDCVGAIRAPLGFLEKEAFAKKAKKSNIFELTFLVSVCLIGSVVLIGVSNSNYKRKMRELEDAKETLDGIVIDQQLKADYDLEMQLLSELQNIYKLSSNNLEDLRTIIEVLEENVVKRSKIDGLQINNDSISMNVTLDSTEAAAKFIMQLECLGDYFGAYEVSGISEAKDEFGNKTVSFSVVLSFNHQPVEESQTTNASQSSDNSEEIME